jgi:hypothetical protein
MILEQLKGNPYGKSGTEEALWRAYEEGKADQRAADQIVIEKLTSEQKLLVEGFVDRVKKLEEEAYRRGGRAG